MIGWLQRHMSRGLQDGKRQRDDSDRWHLVCPACGWARSYAALGGVRHRAAGQGKSRTDTCPGCGTRQRLTTKWIAPAADALRSDDGSSSV